MTQSLRPDAARHHHISLPDLSATAKLGAAIAQHLRRGDGLMLSGALGAGKTTLARAIIGAAQIAAGLTPEDVPSPTYTLVQTYSAGELTIWHADLYRLNSAAEVVELGLDEALATGVLLVEWPEKLGAALPADRLDISLSGMEGQRYAEIAAHGSWHARFAYVAAGEVTGS
jgi:tRNA threonylcarbamoyladenosine biosynthesis protein TsaE